MQADLQRRFPNAHITADPSGLGETLHTIIQLMHEPAQALDLPLDIRGTAFQLRVWQALRAIPAGETRSYSQIAAAIAAPKAVRAVARSCAENPLALAIPCHRVIASNGSLAGYRWGLERKRALLAREAGG